MYVCMYACTRNVYYVCLVLGTTLSMIHTHTHIDVCVLTTSDHLRCLHDCLYVCVYVCRHAKCILCVSCHRHPIQHNTHTHRRLCFDHERPFALYTRLCVCMYVCTQNAYYVCLVLSYASHKSIIYTHTDIYTHCSLHTVLLYASFLSPKGAFAPYCNTHTHTPHTTHTWSLHTLSYVCMCMCMYVIYVFPLS